MESRSFILVCSFIFHYFPSSFIFHLSFFPFILHNSSFILFYPFFIIHYFSSSFFTERQKHTPPAPLSCTQGQHTEGSNLNIDFYALYFRFLVPIVEHRASRWNGFVISGLKVKNLSLTVEKTYSISFGYYFSFRERKVAKEILRNRNARDGRTVARGRNHASNQKQQRVGVINASSIAATIAHRHRFRAGAQFKY